ncbi:MAG TPA: tetratricopeptide repeat protein [Allosphingosinicella sp.]|nr:tetratricopeptide repeat protein [Allosphingosinicella sp.]
MNDRSVSAGQIAQSIVITGDGNQATIRFGSDFSLPLERRQIASPRRRARGDYNPLPLLAPDAGVIPLVGRDRLLEELRGWLDSDPDISVHALIGSAGTGKTRLAIELCKAVDGARRPGAAGWSAGFLRPSDLISVVEQLATRSYEWTGHTLIVVDYAAAVHRELARWLDRLAGDEIAGKLRFLLLDRVAPRDFGWWIDLTQVSTHRATTRADLFLDPNEPQLLPGISEPAGRRAVLAAALAAASKLAGGKSSGEAVPAEGADLIFDQMLANARFGNPLNLAMAGIIAAERGPMEALALRRLEAARHLARRERDRMVLLGRSEGIADRAMCHALSFNGLVSGLIIRSLRRDLAAELGAANIADDVDSLAKLLEQELSHQEPDREAGAELRLGTIQPDLIGEGLIVETMLVGPQNFVATAPETLQRAYALAGTRCAEALMRLVQDYGYALEDPQASEAEQQVAQPLVRLPFSLAEAVPDGDIRRLEMFVAAIPDDTTVLRELAAQQTERVANFWKNAADSYDGDDEELLLLLQSRAAGSKNDLANRLGDLGRREEALLAAQEAVDSYRKLSAVHPDIYTYYLALALNNLTGFLRDVGKGEAALAASEEAVELRRLLADEHPDGQTDELAMALGNLANRLSEMGHQERALLASKEAAALFRELAERQPELFGPHLAKALSNLSVILSSLGRLEDALAAVEEAVRMRRMLAAAKPDAFTPGLATSLNNLAIRLTELARHEEALPVAQETVALFRMLARTRPEAFNPSLSAALGNLNGVLSNLGKREAALATAQEALEMHRVLADAHPDVFRPHVAMSLSNLAIHLLEAGQEEAALTAMEEAVDLFRAFSKVRPDAFIRHLATSLNNMSSFLRTLGKHEAALAMAREAVDLRRGLAAAQPEAFTSALAQSLRGLANSLEDNGRIQEAAQTNLESLRQLLPYFQNAPHMFAHEVSSHLRNYLRRCSEAGIVPDEDLTRQFVEKLASFVETEDEHRS